MPVGALLPAGLGIADAVAGGLTSLGIGAETAAAAAPIITSTAGGAALGAGESALFGGNPLTGGLGDLPGEDDVARGPVQFRGQRRGRHADQRRQRQRGVHRMRHLVVVGDDVVRRHREGKR